MLAPCTRTWIRLGRPTAWPCSTITSAPFFALPWATSWAASGPAALPVAGSSQIHRGIEETRVCRGAAVERIEREQVATLRGNGAKLGSHLFSVRPRPLDH